MKLSPHEILKHLGFEVPLDGIEIDPAEGRRTTTLLQLLGRQMRLDAIADADLQMMLDGTPGALAAPEELVHLRTRLSGTLHRVFGMKTASAAPVTPEAAAAELARLPFDYADGHKRNAGDILFALRNRASDYRLSKAQSSLALARLEQLLVGLRPLRMAQIYTDFVAQPLLAGFAAALYKACQPTTN